MSEPKKIATLEGVAFNYPAGNNALDRINLDLYQGEVVGLIGANGAGKTTLMKLMAGYMDKSEGKILLGGRPIEEYSNRRLNEFVTLVEQNPESQLVGPTVEDELARACRLMGYEGRVIREKVEFVLKLVRMKQAKEWYLDEMSGGERRRVALALALVSDPSILLLDEPLSDLDMVGQCDTAATLRELKNRGLCVIVSSHRLEDILEFTDRIVVLGEGRLLAAEEPRKVLSDSNILKLASITVPPIPRLFMRLQEEGVLAQGRFPLGFEEAVAILREELDRRKKPAASIGLSKETDKLIQTQTLPRIEEVAGGPVFDADKTLVLKTAPAPAREPGAKPPVPPLPPEESEAAPAASGDSKADEVASEATGPADQGSVASKLSL